MLLHNTGCDAVDTPFYWNFVRGEFLNWKMLEFLVIET